MNKPFARRRSARGRFTKGVFRGIGFLPGRQNFAITRVYVRIGRTRSIFEEKVQTILEG